MIRLLAGWQNGDGTMKETTFEERLGYMVYTEQFAGNLEGVREHLEYLRELGADRELTDQFLRMGVDELSVNPKSVLKVRKVVRGLDLSLPEKVEEENFH